MKLGLTIGADMYTKFYDMNSGGAQKLGVSTIFIEAPEEQAVDLFQSIFGLDPRNVTCHCCGEDYWVLETEDEPEHGNWVVTEADIENFKGGKSLSHLSS